MQCSAEVKASERGCGDAAAARGRKVKDGWVEPALLPCDIYVGRFGTTITRATAAAIIHDDVLFTTLTCFLLTAFAMYIASSLAACVRVFSQALQTFCLLSPALISLAPWVQYTIHTS